MDNITHTLAGALLGQMGLKRQSRFAMAACLLGANAPDIDVFAPLIIPVDGISFHRGPIHGIFAWPILAFLILALLWLFDRLRPATPDAVPLRAGPLFLIALLSVASHPFLDWLTTYAIAIFSPLSERWYSGDAIFIVDWVYWLLMIVGIVWSAARWRRGTAHPGRPAQIAAALMLGYIAFNLGESTRVENAATARLRASGIEPTLVVSGPPPFAFWRRSIEWRSADRFGSGAFDLVHGLTLQPTSAPIDLDAPQLAAAKARDSHVRAFLVWSRMPIVIEEDGRTYLTDQRFYNSLRSRVVPAAIRRFFQKSTFLVPLDNNEGNT